ncbi:MAG: hypothetical protein AB8H47_10150 [Bacteroidia bacterium]
MKKFRNHLLVKGFMSMPLWGKIAIPVAMVVLLSMLKGILSTGFYLGIVLLVAYLGFSAFLYIKDKSKS